MQSRMRFSAAVCLRRMPSSSMPICSSSRSSFLAASALPPPQPARPASAQARPTATSRSAYFFPHLLLPFRCFRWRRRPRGRRGRVPLPGVDRHQPLGRQARLDPDVPGRAVRRLHLHPGRPVRRHRQRRHRNGQDFPFGRLHGDRLHHRGAVQAHVETVGGHLEVEPLRVDAVRARRGGDLRDRAGGLDAGSVALIATASPSLTSLASAADSADSTTSRELVTVMTGPVASSPTLSLASSTRTGSVGKNRISPAGIWMPSFVPVGPLLVRLAGQADLLLGEGDGVGRLADLGLGRGGVDLRGLIGRRRRPTKARRPTTTTAGATAVVGGGGAGPPRRR